MMQPESSYNGLVRKAAADLEAAMRANPFRTATVWAIPTYENLTGQLLVTENPPPETFERPSHYWPRVIRPNDNGASGHSTWGTVPYSAQYETLWRACRREPILPVE